MSTSTTPTQTQTETREQYLNRSITAIKTGILRFLYNMDHKNKTVPLVDELFAEQDYILKRAIETQVDIEEELEKNPNVIGLRQQILFMINMMEHAHQTLTSMKVYLEKLPNQTNEEVTESKTDSSE